MREYLFRGKRLDNGEWVEGDLSQDRDLGTAYVQGFDYYCDECGLQREPFGFEVDPETVGQFTGLADQKGNRAFTDSVIRYSGEYGHVVYGVVRFGEVPADPGWDLQNIGFWVEWQNDGANTWNEWWRNDLGFWLNDPSCEIIGNRFDNPELLEGV